MSKGDKTRQQILHKVAILFNEKGYAATSMQDITAATGIQRGGIYNHFSSKEALALATFDYACSLLEKRLIRGISGQRTAVGRLRAIASSFVNLYTQNPLFPCGCQIMNTAIEAKRHMPALRHQAQRAMTRFKDLIVKTVVRGIEHQEFPDTVNTDAMAAVFISTLEGAMLLSVLYDDEVYLNYGAQHLHGYVDSLADGPVLWREAQR